MTRRATITQAALDRAAKTAKGQGVTVTITAPDGTVYSVAPAGVAVKDDDGLAAWQARKAQRANTRPL